MSNLYSELQSLSPSAMVEMYELDLSSKGGASYRFCADTNPLSGNIVWQGATYTRLPLEGTGFARNSNGTLPRPLLRLSNILGSMGALARQYDYFLGCKITRRRTFARFLDSVNFSSPNPDADPTQHLVDEIWFIDRKSSENATLIEFELASILDMQGVMLPRRQMIQNVCTWKYRSPECSYNGGPVAKPDGSPTADPQQDSCGKRLSDCKLRFREGYMPFGGFPGVGLIK